MRAIHRPRVKVLLDRSSASLCMNGIMRLTSACSAPADQVAAALQKIVTHISNPRRFKKASPLLRQLLSQGAVAKAHAGLLFEASASMQTAACNGLSEGACNTMPAVPCRR